MRTLLYLHLLLSAAAANNLTFLSPPDASSLTIANSTAYLIQWTTNFTQTDLTIFSGPDDNNLFSWQPLATNLTSDFTSFNWTAGPINGQNLRYNLHLELANGQDHDCVGCRANSAIFRVSQNGIDYSNAAQTTSTSSVASATAAPSTAASASPPALTSSIASSPVPNHQASLAIGVAVGLGVPTLLAIGLCLFWRHKGRQKRDASGDALMRHDVLGNTKGARGEVRYEDDAAPVFEMEQAPVEADSQYLVEAEARSPTRLEHVARNDTVHRWELEGDKGNK
ncbi:hypothetical protein LTR86_008328 [Recurvomyces mirabilis]|nr:hypothetical protein LTR86_008328 [Recurvomyces mirabilis]